MCVLCHFHIILVFVKKVFVYIYPCGNISTYIDTPYAVFAPSCVEELFPSTCFARQNHGEIFKSRRGDKY